MDVAYFRRADPVEPSSGAAPEWLCPEPTAASLWGGGTQLRGSAVSGALAREAERVAAADGGSELMPVRWTLDLFRPAAMRECTTSGRVVRAGRRLRLVDVVLRQGARDEVEVARASALFLAPSAVEPASVWAPALTVDPPPGDLEPGTTEARLYFSEGIGWTATPGPHRNARRKRTWLFGVPIVRGENPSPFQLAAMAGDVTNVVVNWGADGIGHINADVSVNLARLPHGGEVGVAAELRIEQAGVVVAVATLFDRGGVFGTAAVSALANPSGPIDPRELGEPLPRR